MLTSLLLGKAQSTPDVADIGLSLTANRLIPLTVELYVRTQEEFPDLNLISKDDSEYKLLFTCNNKDATSPFAVDASDLSNTDKQEIVFISPEEERIVRQGIFETDGTDGLLFFICGLNDLNLPGTWQAKPMMTEGDVEINYPNVPIVVY